MLQNYFRRLSEQHGSGGPVRGDSLKNGQQVGAAGLDNSQAIEDRLQSAHLGYVWRGSPELISRSP